MDQGMFEAVFHRSVPPGFIFHSGFSFGLDRFGEGDQFFGGFVIVIVTIEDHILA